MNQQVGLKILIGLAAFTLGLGVMFLVGALDRDTNSSDQTAGVKQEVPIAVEIEPEVAETPVLTFRGREIKGVKVPIGEVQGDLGEIVMTQEFYDELVANPSCETLSEFSSNASMAHGENPEALYVLPWVPGEYTNCEHVQNDGTQYFLFISLQSGYDGIITLNDGIMLLEKGDFYVFENVSAVADWKKFQISHELAKDYPLGDIGTPELEAYQQAYWQALVEYFDQPNGEIYWTMEMMKNYFEYLSYSDLVGIGGIKFE